MKKPRLQQKGERRIAAALRIALAAALLAVQVLFVVLTTRYLKDHFALIYGALEGIALITALYIYNKPGDLSYRVAWIIPILFVPVVGLILYLLWGGDTQRKRLQRQTVPKLPPEEPERLRNRSALNADRLQRALPGWSRVSQYLSSRGFYLYQNTKAVYLPEGALLLEDILGRIKAAERFIFMEYFILAEGKLWDRMSAALCERARSGVEVKIIFDDFGNLTRPMNDGEKGLMQMYVNNGYDLFLTRCSDGRGISKEDLDKIAQGRVWTGSKAKELGLVDELGGLDKALDIAIAKAGVDAYTVMSYPKKESFFESLMNTNPGNYVKARMLKGTMGEIYQQFSVLENFDKCDRIQARVPFELNIQ